MRPKNLPNGIIGYLKSIKSQNVKSKKDERMEGVSLHYFFYCTVSRSLLGDAVFKGGEHEAGVLKKFSLAGLAELSRLFYGFDHSSAS